MAGAPKRSGLERRSAARLAAVQALYQMDIAGVGMDSVIAEYENFRLGQEIDGEQYISADATFFRDIVSGVVGDQRRIDQIVDDILSDNWPLAQIDSILRALLRAASFELIARTDIPPRVVIAEYLDVADAFFGVEEKRLANGVLDRVARQVRGEDELTPSAATSSGSVDTVD